MLQLNWLAPGTDSPLGRGVRSTDLTPDLVAASLPPARAAVTFPVDLTPFQMQK